jgi:hypothetical protein
MSFSGETFSASGAFTMETRSSAQQELEAHPALNGSIILRVFKNGKLAKQACH